MAGTLAASQAKAYEMVNSISFDNAHFRTDIAAKALK
jgi:phosphoribosylamine-glycine ligase